MTFTRGDTVTYTPHPGAHPMTARVFGMAYGANRYDLELTNGQREIDVSVDTMERTRDEQYRNR